MLPRRNNKGPWDRTRRHDTPAYFSKFQREILEMMAQGNNIKEVRARMLEVKHTFQKYKQQLKEGRVPLVDLIFTKMITKNSDAYTANTVETSAISQLQDEGKTMQAGQILQYIITDFNRKNSRKRSTPVALINEKTTYDSKRYTGALSSSMQFSYRAIWIFYRALVFSMPRYRRVKNVFSIF